MKKVLIFIFWLILWQGFALIMDNPILLVGPIDTGIALFSLCKTLNFWTSIAYSCLKIMSGFLLALLCGIALGCISYFHPLFEDILKPVMSLIKSIPVASFVILALIWMGSKNLSIFSSAIVVLPMIYTSTIAGLKSTDKKLLEMAEVFQVRNVLKARYIYFPALLPYLINSLKTALGMAWKSGVAAEVIGVPDLSIGNGLYMAKIYLNTADLFAWTFVIILISSLSEKVVLTLLRRFP